MNHYQITSSDPSQDAININSCMRGDIGTKWSLVDQYLKHNRDQETAELSDVILAIDDRHPGAWFAKGKLFLY